jgi:hypothetical protein
MGAIFPGIPTEEATLQERSKFRSGGGVRACRVRLCVLLSEAETRVALRTPVRFWVLSSLSLNQEWRHKQQPPPH